MTKSRIHLCFDRYKARRCQEANGAGDQRVSVCRKKRTDALSALQVRQGEGRAFQGLVQALSAICCHLALGIYETDPLARKALIFASPIFFIWGLSPHPLEKPPWPF